MSPAEPLPLRVDELTIRAATILSAQRIARQLTVNALAVAVLNDQRAAPEPTAAQPEPHAKPRVQAGVTTADYVNTYYALSEAVTRGVEARVEGDLAYAARLHRRADRLADTLEEVETALRRSLSRAPTGHLTTYRVKVPAVAYAHPDPAIGIHARQDARTVLIDTLGLSGDDLQTFLAFRRDFPARGRWPLYAVHVRDGLQATGHHALSDEARRLFGELIAQHPGSVPQVYPVSVADEVPVA